MEVETMIGREKSTDVEKVEDEEKGLPGRR